MKNKNTVVQDSQQNQNKGGYGVLSLMAMIVGIVIGSGIFAKNAGLITSAGSVPMVALAWLVGALVVVTFVIAFIEIISITEISGEQSTIANWGRHLLGIRFGKFIGYYITLVYFPIIIAALFQFASDSFLHSISYAISSDHTDIWYQNLTADAPSYMAAVVAVSFTFLIIIMGINALAVSPGKIFQNLGTMVKTIPLFAMIIIFFVMLGKADGVHFASKDELEAAGVVVDAKPFMLLMATLPAVLFAFDGFLLAGAMSKEAKSPSGFRVAFVASMIFITAIYLLYSLAILGLGTAVDMGHGKYGSISNAVYAVFEDPNTAAAVDITVTSIITISMLTGVSGCSIASYRSLSDLSVHNAVRDTEGALLVKNKRGVAQNSGLAIIGVTAFWFFTMVTFDTYLSSAYGASLAIADFGSSIIIVVAYFIYSLIIFGGLINRFTHKSPSKKNALFIPASLVAVALTTVITIMFGYQILDPSALNGDDTTRAIYFCKLGFTGIFLGMIVFFWLFNEITTIRIPEHVKAAKKEKSATYYGLTLEEFEAEKEAVEARIAEERASRKKGSKPSSSDNEEKTISDKEAKKLAKEEMAREKEAAAEAKAAAKKSKKTQKEVENLNKDDDYKAKKVAPKSKR